MTRQIFLDTETTGLNPESGDRIVEIGCIEMVNRRLTGDTRHVYLNPERKGSEDAIRIHGLTDAFLADKPKFAEVADDLVAWLAGADVVIHNAAFDVGFLNYELGLLGRPTLTAQCPSVIDTLKLAKEQNPGKKASLNALCALYEIDNTHRTLHGALLDAELLADVYLAMTRGQESLIMSLDEPPPRMDDGSGSGFVERPPLRVLRVSPEELEGHERVLGEIAKANKGNCMWIPPAPPAEA